MSRRFAPLLPLLAACLSAGATQRTVTTGTPECVAGDVVRVRFDGCLSSSCDTLVSAACTVSEADGVAEITGRAEVEREGDVCTDDCGFMQATCAGSLGAATAVRFGNTVVDRSALPACDAP